MFCNRATDMEGLRRVNANLKDLPPVWCVYVCRCWYVCTLFVRLTALVNNSPSLCTSIEKGNPLLLLNSLGSSSSHDRSSSFDLSFAMVRSAILFCQKWNYNCNWKSNALSRTRGFAWGPCWALPETCEVLVWLKSDLGQIRAFTSHTWLSDTGKSPCHDTVSCMALHGQTWQLGCHRIATPTLCMVIPVNLPTELVTPWRPASGNNSSSKAGIEKLTLELQRSLSWNTVCVCVTYWTQQTTWNRWANYTWHTRTVTRTKVQVEFNMTMCSSADQIRDRKWERLFIPPWPPSLIHSNTSESVWQIMACQLGWVRLGGSGIKHFLIPLPPPPPPPPSQRRRADRLIGKQNTST